MRRSCPTWFPGRLAWTGLLLLAALLLPASVHAQCKTLADGTVWCDDGSGPGTETDNVPYLVVSPGDLRTSQPTLPVTITGSDDKGIVDSTFHIYAAGVDVTSSFSITKTVNESSPVRVRFTATGTIRLSETGPTEVFARVCDTAPEPQCVTTEQIAMYVLTLPGVVVTPDAGTATVAAGARTQAFTVRNTGTDTATFRLTAECRNAETGAPVSGCTVPASLSLLKGGSQAVSVSFPGTAGQPLTAGLTATQAAAPGVQDAGWVNVTVSGAAGSTRMAPGLRLVDLNTGSTPVLRSQCVTVAAGPGAAYECGDLRMAHALPAQRTLGRTWAPVLLYNSQHADPRPTMYFDVTLPEGAAVPWRMLAVVYFPGGQQLQVPFDGAQWQPGTTRRIAMQMDGSAMSNGEYLYHAQVIAQWYDGQISSVVHTSTVHVVNRTGSLFGSGWWIAGLESIRCLDCGSGGSRLMWIGGDGSTRLYEPTVPGGWTTWISRNAGAAPDTLTLVGYSYYIRRVPGGGRVEFNGSGQHVRTIDRLGRVTTFNWQDGRLTGIQVPAAGGAAAPGYTFTYDAAGILTQVTATTPGAPARTVLIGRELGDARVTYIQDPDGHRVRFAYGHPQRARLVTQRIDRRGTALAFAWSGTGRLTSSSLAVSASESIVTAFEAVEDKGVAASVPLASAYTLLDGPRTDVEDRTWIWHTDRGAPRRIRDALGAETMIIRDDPRFPALATHVIGPRGHSQVVYDARARDSLVIPQYGALGDSRYLLKRYTYDDRWDAPTQIRTKWVDGNTGVATQLEAPVTLTYDAVGNVVSRMQGPRDDWFYYYPSWHRHAGMLAYTLPALDAERRRGRDSLVYDAQGNLAMTVSPSGFLSLHYRDALGRDTLTITPIDAATATTEANLRAYGARHRTTYDVMDRPTRTESIGPARTYTAVNGSFVPSPTQEERLVVVTGYDNAGAPISIHRWATPDYDGGTGFLTEYTYDGAGRKLTESSTQAGTQSFTYDPAGNVTMTRTATGFEVRMRYDALGRLTRRTVPERSYSRACDEIALTFTCEYFPRFPNNGTGYKVPEEWHHYRFDAAGNQVYAENADARVQRTYFPSGAVRTDSTWIRGAADMSYAAYGLRYTYDMAGRVTALEHPANLTGGTPGADQFFYHAVTGALSTGRSRQGLDFTFHNAPDGQLTSMRLPGGIVDSMRYDVEGRLVWRHEYGPYAGTLHQETLQYDARGKLLRADNGASAFQNWYSGLGTLVGNDWYNLTQNVAGVAEELRTDPLGTTTLRRTSEGADANYGEFPQFQNIYQPSTGRLIAMRRLPPLNPGSDFIQDSTGQHYDAGGNVIRTYRRAGREQSGGYEIGQEVQTRSYYGADDRLRVFQKMDVRRTDWSNHEDAGVWEEYRYDPLGRRVMVWTRTEGGLCNYDGWGCTESTTRFVWAGDQLLWELKSAPGAAGGNVSYFHAGGIDRPLVITRDGTSIIPHQNWRGQFSRGTYTNGYRSDCTSYPASGCTPIQWPGERTTVRHELEPDGNIRNWFGGLVDGMRDQSGQMYMRNRYYDPQTGQFTQADPIGLAGGLNAFGFADGDPVSYSDPYGLCPNPLGGGWGSLQCALEDIVGAVRNAPRAVANSLRSSDGRRATRFTVRLASTPFVIGPVGRTASVARAVSLPTRVGGTVGTHLDEAHNFARIIDNYADDAAAFSIPKRGPGGTVVGTAELRQIEGSMRTSRGWRDGVFEWIVDGGEVTHRRFIPGGKVTGTPNQVVK